MREPLEQDEWTTLEAELRRAVQHRSAAFERMQQTQREMEALMARARVLIARARDERERIARAATAEEGAGRAAERTASEAPRAASG